LIQDYPTLISLAVISANPGISPTGGVGELVARAGPVVKFVLLLLFLLSVATWTIIFFKYLQLRLARTRSQTFSRIFWEKKQLEVIMEETQKLSGCPLRALFQSGFSELTKVQKTRSRRPEAEAETGLAAPEGGGIENVERSLRRAFTSETSRLESYLTFLATTASAAPFIGLFGTVWGIMDTFQGIGRSGSASLAVVAPGISEALIATAFGLAAAIPAVLAYNYFVNQVRNLSNQMEGFTQDFLNICQRHFI
jgi:biopolymer transport protein TolQ